MLHNLAVVERAMGRTDEAIVLFLDAIARHKVLGDVAGEARCLANLALAYWSKGQLESAVAHSQAAPRSAIAMASSKRGCRSSPT